MDCSDRVGVLVTGPNASGKTTAVRSALAGYARDGRVRVILADNSDRSKDVLQAEDMLAEIWCGPAQLVLVEGTRVPTVLERVVAAHPSVRALKAFVTVTSPEIMEAHLRARCAALGKRFRDDYWIGKPLRYESQARYRVSVPRFVPAGDIHWFDVDETYTGAAQLASRLREAVHSAVGGPRVDPLPEFILS